MVIGGSAGAVEAMMKLIPQFQAKLSFPVIVVLHQLKEGPSLLPHLFAGSTRLKVKEAEPLETPQAGYLYVAPPDYHLALENDGCFSLSNDEPLNYSRPSIDILFKSASEAYGSSLLGVLVTGANHDGSEGLKMIAIRGGYTVVEDPATAKFTDMPSSAIKIFSPDQILTLEQLIKFFADLS